MSDDFLPGRTFPRGRQLTVFAMLVSCFALWGLLNNMTDNLVPAFQRIFTMDPSRAGLVQVAFYGAYAVLALFASIIAEEFSYRVGVLAGLAVYVIGSLLYIPACVYASFDVYFVAIFAVAAGCSLLETTCNPYVLSLGDEATAVRRLNFAQAFNPVGSILGIFLAQKLILANLNPATAAERAQMAPEALAGIVRNELFWVCVPYVGLCALAAVVWVFFLRINPFISTFAQKRVGFGRVGMAGLFALVPLTALYFLFPQMNKVLWIICGMAGPFAYVLLVKDYREMLGILLRRPRYWCGVVAQFFYVGVQIAVWTWLNAYCQQEFGVPPDEAAFYYLASIILFIAMRWVATALMRRVNPALLLAGFAFAAILSTAGVMYLPSTTLFTVLGHPVRLRDGLHVAHVPHDLRHGAGRTRSARVPPRRGGSHHVDPRRRHHHAVDGRRCGIRVVRVVEARAGLRRRPQPGPAGFLPVHPRLVRGTGHLFRGRVPLRPAVLQNHDAKQRKLQNLSVSHCQKITFTLPDRGAHLRDSDNACGAQHGEWEERETRRSFWSFASHN